MIKLNNISKSYSDNIVLKDISINIPDKAITGIIGPNGAGKSTLLKIISGFEFQDSGDVHIYDTKMENFHQRKNHIFYMPENMSIYPEYFVNDFLSFYHSCMHSKDDNLFTILSLKTVLNKKIKHLSKGWHQRLKLYTVLCNKSPIIILDEPFDGFDPLQMKDIINLFKSQNSQGRSFILSIHQLSEAQKICDYFILIDQGTIVAEGTFNELNDYCLCRTNSLEEIFLKALEK